MELNINGAKPLRATEYAEYQLLKGILSEQYPAGSNLPNERILAENLGLTRPTLRETMQRLARDGWITIQHGKPTRVNDYWREGGLGILCSMVRHNKVLSNELILYLLEFRSALLPGVAGLAVQRGKDALVKYLKKSEGLKNNAKQIAEYDWELQILMVNLTENPVFKLIFNDFTPIYKVLAERYFEDGNAVAVSKSYYKNLLEAIEQGSAEVEKVVRQTMDFVIDLWKKGLIK